MKGKTVVLLAIIAVAAAFSVWRMSTPGSYEECIQKHIGSANNETAAKLVHASCIKQFPRVYSDAEVFGAK